MKRLLLVAAVVGVAAVGVLFAANRTRDLLDHLALEARAVYGPQLRQAHVTPPLDAAFGEMLEPLMLEFRTAYDDFRKLPKATQDACAAVREGEQPFSTLPSECRNDLDRHRESLATLLLATHAARLEIPADLDSLRAEDWAPGARGWVPVQHAAKLTALDIRARLAADPLTPDMRRLAVDECLDGLAIARDVSHSRGALGSMLAAALIGLLTQSCAAALDRGSAEEKSRAANTLLRIRGEMRPFSAVLDDESVFAQLAWASALSPEQLDQLPAEAAALAAVHPGRREGWTRLLPGVGWRCTAEEHERLSLVMALPRDGRARALSEIRAKAAGSWNPGCRGAAQDFGPIYSRHLRSLERLELLIAAASADRFFTERRRWPTAEELRAYQTGLEETPFSVTPIDGGVRVGLPDDGHGTVAINLLPDAP